jgi:hypothetical protein
MTASPQTQRMRRIAVSSGPSQLAGVRLDEIGQSHAQLDLLLSQREQLDLCAPLAVHGRVWSEQPGREP